jgi:hypothetical protein
MANVDHRFVGVIPAGNSATPPTDEQLIRTAQQYLKHARIDYSKIRQTKVFQELIHHATAQSKKAEPSDTQHQLSPQEIGWRAALPNRSANLTFEEEVEYLCMSVGINFRHWGEGEEVAVGQPVRTKDFYTLDDCTSPNPPQETPLTRGSQAMTILLKRAVQIHGCKWFSIDELAPVQHEINNSASVDSKEIRRKVSDRLRFHFEGLSLNRQPMLMPAFEERMTILMDIANHFRSKSHYSSFADLLRKCQGFLYNQPGASITGFLPGLLQISSRFDDSNLLKLVGEPTEPEAAPQVHVYFLKLAQLMAIALSSAFSKRNRAEWAHLASPTDWWYESGVTFKDFELLSVCSDYQLPRALRYEGILVYDEHLTTLVDGKYLLGIGSQEETDIRLSSTVASAVLRNLCNETLREKGIPGEVDIALLDWVLWDQGRRTVPPSQPHHLVRGIMY